MIGINKAEIKVSNTMTPKAIFEILSLSSIDMD